MKFNTSLNSWSIDFHSLIHWPKHVLLWCPICILHTIIRLIIEVDILTIITKKYSSIISWCKMLCGWDHQVYPTLIAGFDSCASVQGIRKCRKTCRNILKRSKDSSNIYPLTLDKGETYLLKTKHSICHGWLYLQKTGL